MVNSVLFAAEAAPTCSLDGARRNPGCACNDIHACAVRLGVILTCISSPSCLRRMSMILVRLSIVGLPLAESMRCRLLLDLSTSSASVSKPIVALTRSLSTRRATSGSPFRNRVIASSSKAAVNAGCATGRYCPHYTMPHPVYGAV